MSQVICRILRWDWVGQGGGLWVGLHYDMKGRTTHPCRYPPPSLSFIFLSLLLQSASLSHPLANIRGHPFELARGLLNELLRVF